MTEPDNPTCAEHGHKWDYMKPAAEEADSPLRTCRRCQRQEPGPWPDAPEDSWT